jgi:hypothetical protein
MNPPAAASDGVLALRIVDVHFAPQRTGAYQRTKSLPMAEALPVPLTQISARLLCVGQLIA